MCADRSFEFLITCSCGRSFSREVWTTLPCDGVQSGYDKGKQKQIFEDMELRRCACGSTMAVPVRLVPRKNLPLGGSEKIASTVPVRTK